MLTLQQHQERIAPRLQVPSQARLISLHIVGSHAHGTYIPPADPNGIDDIDVLAIYLPPPGLVLGIDTWEHKQQWVDDYDVTAYSLDKLMRLLAKSNPNVLMLLNMPSDCRVAMSEIWETLLAHKAEFLTKEAMASFCGYANSQLQRMTNSAYNGYMGEKRKAVVDKYGYDCKNAAHLIRLLNMGLDLFITGDIITRRPEYQQLLEIKNGKYSLDEIKQMAEAMFPAIKEAASKSSLPDKINRFNISELSAHLHLKGWDYFLGVV